MRIALLLWWTSLFGCSNSISPDEGDKEGDDFYWVEPDLVMEALSRAFNDRDKDLYEIVIADDFRFTESDCGGNFIYDYGKEEELRILGTRDGSSRGIFDIYRTIEWEFLLARRWNSQWPPGEQAGPEEEEWEGFRGLVKITLLNQPGESYLVEQMMTFKVALDGIKSWVAHPVCAEDDKPELGSSLSWGSFKEPYLQ